MSFAAVIESTDLQCWLQAAGSEGAADKEIRKLVSNIILDFGRFHRFLAKAFWLHEASHFTTHRK